MASGNKNPLQMVLVLTNTESATKITTDANPKESPKWTRNN